MTTATITVQYVNQPKPGKTNGSIKDANGVYYGVRPANLASFQQGGVYDITFSEKPFNGTVYKTVESVKPSAAPAAPTRTAQSGPSPADKLSMFVYGAVTAGIHGGQVQFSAEDIARAIRDARQGYAMGWSDQQNGKPQSTYHQDMNDDIPF